MLKQNEITASANYSSERKYISGFYTQELQTLLHSKLYAAWKVDMIKQGDHLCRCTFTQFVLPSPLPINDFPSGDERFEDLFNEKRIALGQCVNHGKETRPHSSRPPKNSVDHHLHLVNSQVGKPQLGSMPF